MKFLLSLFSFLIFSLLGICQDNTLPTRVATPEEVISHAIEFRAFEGNMAKVIARMGDAASVSVTRIFAEKTPTVDDTHMILVILHSAFTNPSGIDVPTDREPRTTLFVLRDLERCTQDDALKKQIVETRTYVQQRFAKYKAEIAGNGSSR